MSFTIFENSKVANATEFKENFYEIAKGSYLPRSGVSLTATDSANDMGSSSFAWLTGHFMYWI